MCKRILVALIASILVSFTTFTLSAQEMLSPDPADLILRNGLIYTVDATNTMTEAIAIRDGKFLQYMLDADHAGLQITVHAIGDEANNVLLNYLEELNRQNGVRDRRFRLVHAQVVAPDDFKRLGKLGVVAEVQPFHLSDDMRWMEERIGRERSKGAYAFKSIKDSGAVLCFGTDWPGTSASEYPINPMLGL